MLVIKRGIADIVLTAPIVNSVVVVTMFSAVKFNAETVLTVRNVFSVRQDIVFAGIKFLTVGDVIALIFVMAIALIVHTLTAFLIAQINYTVIRRKNGLLKTRYLPKRNSFRNEHCHQ